MNYPDKTIQFSQIEFHPEIVNCREKVDDIPELAMSIEEQGLHTPPTMLQLEEEGVTHYYMIAGFRRFAAIQFIRSKTPSAFDKITIRPIRMTLADAQVVNLTENLQRKNLSPMEVANAVERLVVMGFKQKEIAQKLGKSQSWVSNALAFKRTAVPALREAVKDGTISFSMAQQLATLSESKQNETIARLSPAMETPPPVDHTVVIEASASSNGHVEPTAVDTTLSLVPQVAVDEEEEQGGSLEEVPETAKPKAKPSTKVKQDVRREIREQSEKKIRPSVKEVRSEIDRLEMVNEPDQYTQGMIVALKWSLGEIKALELNS